MGTWLNRRNWREVNLADGQKSFSEEIFGEWLENLIWWDNLAVLNLFGQKPLLNQQNRLK